MYAAFAPRLNSTRIREFSAQAASTALALLGRLALAQLHPADLAADRLGQLGHELDLARVLVRRRHPLHVLLQLHGQRVRRLVAGRQDAERLDVLAADL